MNSKKKIFIQIITNFILAIGIGLSFYFSHDFFKQQTLNKEENELLENIKWRAELFATELSCNKSAIDRFEQQIRGSSILVKSYKDFEVQLRPRYEGGDYFILDSENYSVLYTTSKYDKDELVNKFVEGYKKSSKILNGLKIINSSSGIEYSIAYSKPTLAPYIFILKVPSESLLRVYNLIQKRNFIVASLIYIFLSILNFISIKLLT